MWRSAALVIGLAPPATGLAQTVRGTVLDRADATPIAGVVVLLVGAGTDVVGRALTNERGEFRLTAPAPGLYRLRTLRIGFRPVSSEPIALVSGQEMPRDIEVASVPFTLDTVRVVRRATCGLRADSALVTYGIWEQVRAALTATDISSRSRNLGATLVTFDRSLDPDTRRVREQNSAVRTGITSKPWISMSADSLHRLGYLFESDGWLVYSAPDIDVLLSARFLEDHCFSIADRSDSATIGLTFEPTSERRRTPEIRGTVWLDRKSSELRRMEFSYTNVTRELTDREAGGEMDFVRFKNGAWAISRWNIRMPVLKRVMARRDVSLPLEPAIRATEIRVSGGELALVTRGSDTLLARPPIVIRGLISDSASGRAVAGARVALRGTTLRGVTDDAGKFTIAGALPGEYTLQVRTPAFDSIAAIWQSDIAVSDMSPQVGARLPTVADVIGRMCSSREASGSGLVVGVVRVAGDSTPRRNVEVDVEWNEFTGTAAAITRTTRAAEGRTDATGTYRICGVPVNTPFDVRTGVDDSATHGRIPAGARFVRVDVTVDNATAAVVAQRTNSAGFGGRVVNQANRQPIAEAEVVLPELDVGTRTNADGTFSIASVPAGEHLVVVRRLGFVALSVRLLFSADAPTRKEFQLAAAQLLDTIAVAAARPRLSAFEERRKLGIGHFISREELAKQENRRTSEVLSQLGGLRIVRAMGGGQAWAATGRGGMDAIAPDAVSYQRGARPACYADVYLDGVRVYTGVSGASLWDVNSIEPGSLEAIEYYSGVAQIPIQYRRSGQPCGVLLLWTRRGP